MARRSRQIYRREARDVEEVTWGKARNWVRQGKAEQNNASQRGVKYLFS